MINRLIPLNDGHVKAVDDARDPLWPIYHDLKTYNQLPNRPIVSGSASKPCVKQKPATKRLISPSKRMGKNQHELLRVLDKPYRPLHNNLNERDIKGYVKKRKISGSARSDAGQKARDTFASLKKTCRKHGISFWDYLKNRLLGVGDIPPLSEVIRAAAASG